MSQKNKIFSITLSLLILGSVACRKSGGGGITQTDPIRNLAGNLLIVSADGMNGANSLPLSFAGENLSRYTDTADIFVGKYSNIYTTTFDEFTNLSAITSDDIADAAGGHTTEQFKLEFTKMTNATTNESILILENSLNGSTANNIDTQKFIRLVSNRMYTNSIGNFKTYFNDFKFVSFDTFDKKIVSL